MTSTPEIRFLILPAQYTWWWDWGGLQSIPYTTKPYPQLRLSATTPHTICAVRKLPPPCPEALHGLQESPWTQSKVNFPWLHQTPPTPKFLAHWLLLLWNTLPFGSFEKSPEFYNTGMPFSLTAPLTTNRVQGLCPGPAPETLSPKLATAASTMVVWNKAHSDPVSPSAIELQLKLCRR